MTQLALAGVTTTGEAGWIDNVSITTTMATPTCTSPQVLQNGACVTPAAPSVVTLAKLSDDVYNTGGKGNAGFATYKPINIAPPSLLPGVGNTQNSGSTPQIATPTPRLVQTSPGVFEGDGGFKANVYQDPVSNQIVIAVRGTNPGDGLLYNLLADGSFAPQGGAANQLLISYSSYLAEIVSEVHASVPTATISLTGHSLGGSVAQIVGKAIGVAVTSFDAPGAKNTLNDVRANVPLLGTLAGLQIPTPSKDITNYRMAGDMVSLIGESASGAVDAQLGSTITVANPGVVNLNSAASEALPVIVATWKDLKYNHSIATLEVARQI